MNLFRAARPSRKGRSFTKKTICRILLCDFDNLLPVVRDQYRQSRDESFPIYIENEMLSNEFLHWTLGINSFKKEERILRARKFSQ